MALRFILHDRIHLTTQRQPVRERHLCVVWHAAQAKKIYCVSVTGTFWMMFVLLLEYGEILFFYSLFIYRQSVPILAFL